MKKLVVASLFLLLAVTSAFAHAGEVHTYMGSVTMVHSDTEFMMKTTAGKDVTVQTTPATTWLHADGHAAKRSEPRGWIAGRRADEQGRQDCRQCEAQRAGEEMTQC